MTLESMRSQIGCESIGKGDMEKNGKGLCPKVNCEGLRRRRTDDFRT